MKQKVRVLYYLPGGSFSVGGANSQLYVLIKNLNKEQFDVEIIGNANLTRLRQIPGIKYTDLKKAGVINIYKYVKHLYKLNGGQMLIMHVSSIRGLLVGVFVKLLMGKSSIKLIYTEHLWTTDFHLENGIREMIHKVTLKIATGFADEVVCVSNAVKDFLLQLGVDKCKLQVIYNGINISTARHKLVSSKVCRFVTVGSINRIKNYKLMLDIVGYLQKHLPFAVEFTIIGDGDLKKEVKEYSEEVATKNLRFLGWLEGSSLQSGVLKSDFYLQLSFSESFGLAVLEGMSLGVIPIVSNKGGLIELVDKSTGFICDIDSVFKQELKTYVQKIFLNPSLYEEISKRVIKKSQNFTASRMVEKYSKLYLSL